MNFKKLFFILSFVLCSKQSIFMHLQIFLIFAFFSKHLSVSIDYYFFPFLY